MEKLSELKNCLQPANELPSFSTTYGDMSTWTKKFYPLPYSQNDDYYSSSFGDDLSKKYNPSFQKYDDNTKMHYKRSRSFSPEKVDRWFDRTTSRDMTNWTRFHKNECLKKTERPTDSFVQPLEKHYNNIGKAECNGPNCLSCHWKCDGVHNSNATETKALQQDLTYKPMDADYFKELSNFLAND